MAGQNISHEGHRQRMRARVEQYGLESLAPHEALEYLLYITNARRDTNGIAHALLERFGSFAGVLEASEEELCRVPGVGPASARMLHLLPEVSRYYEHSRTSTEGVNHDRPRDHRDLLVQHRFYIVMFPRTGKRPRSKISDKIRCQRQN